MEPTSSLSLVCGLQLLWWSGLQSHGEVLQRTSPGWSMGLLWWVQQDWGNPGTRLLNKGFGHTRAFFPGLLVPQWQGLCVFYGPLHNVSTPWTKQKQPQGDKMPRVYTNILTKFIHSLAHSKIYWATALCQILCVCSLYRDEQETILPSRLL